jgi:hypothetical protein
MNYMKNQNKKLCFLCGILIIQTQIQVGIFTTLVNGQIDISQTSIFIHTNIAIFGKFPSGGWGRIRNLYVLTINRKGKAEE